MELSTAIRVMLLSRNESQRDLADAIGMSYSTLSNKFHGRNRFSVEDLRRILKHFEITPDELYSIFFAE